MSSVPRPLGARVSKVYGGPSGARSDIKYDVIMEFEDGLTTETKEVQPHNLRPGKEDTDIIVAARENDPVYVSLYGNEYLFIIIETMDLEDC